MLLDSFADGDTASHHRAIVSQVKNEQISFVTEHCCDG